MDLSIIIACSRPTFIDECLKGFAAQQTNFQFEIIVAGNVAGINHATTNVRLLEVQEQHPNTKRNHGLTIAQANLVAIMDDDTIPCITWVQTAVDTSRNYSGAVLTGPENVYPSANSFARLSHQLFSSPVAEFSKAHTHLKFEAVKWYDAPFCNVVFPKQIWIDAGGLDETIPWHMDDFHFFFGFRNKISFLNIPVLQICHNRYPASLLELIKYKWRLRTETGEKLMSHAQIYWRVIPVVVAFAVSLASILSMLVLIFIKPVVVVLLAVAYFVLLFLVTAWRVGFSVPSNVLKGVAIISSVHFISVAGLYFGLVREGVKRIFNRRF